MGSHWIATKWMANHPQECSQKTPHYPSCPSAIPWWWGLAVNPSHGVQQHSDETESNLLHTPRRTPAHWGGHCAQLIQGSGALKFRVCHQETESASSCTSPWSTIRHVCWTYSQKEPCQLLALEIKTPNLCHDSGQGICSGAEKVLKTVWPQPKIFFLVWESRGWCRGYSIEDAESDQNV